MSWKKNGFSYILWIAYTLAAGSGLLGVNILLCGHLGYKAVYAYGISGAFLLVAGVVALCLYQLTKRLPGNHKDNTMLQLVMEGVVLIGLVAVGIILRIDALQQITEWNGMHYYEAAMVAEGQTVPQIVHGATYIYVSLLHLLLLLVGNKLWAAIWLQVVIQLLAITALYFAVRRLSGVIQALVTAAVLLMSPYMISGALELSPEWLYLFLYSIALWVVSGRMDKTESGLLHYLVGGILIGVCTYLDIYGITLLVFVAGVFAVMRDRPAKKLLHERGTVFLVYIAGTLLGWFAAIIIDCISCRNGFAAVVKAWSLLYVPKSFRVPVNMELLTEVGMNNVLAVLGLMSLGIFSFWCRKKRERQGVWIGVAIVLLLLQSLGMMTDHIDGVRYLYVVFVILAGIGAANCFATHRASYKEEADDVEEAVNEPVTEDPVEIQEPAVVEMPDAQKSVAMKRTEVQENMVAENMPVEVPEKKVKFLDNPLPLPKKHVAKVMDYRITDVGTDAGYDYDVAEDDDYDI